MRLLAYLCSIVLLLQCIPPCGCFEPVSGLAAAFAAVGSAVYTGFDAIRCRVSVCCNERWIVADITGLERDLKEKLHGQHLVQKTVLGHIRGHVKSKNPTKALTLSFHGLTGVGKNYVSRIIADNVYRDGMRSKFVHLISATKEFPHEGMVPFYKDQLKSWIEGNVSVCEQSMFIFDEVDKLPSLLLDVLKPYVDHYEHLGGVDYRKSIFLFLSNTGGTEIGQLALEHWKSGKKREMLELRDVEHTVMLSAFNADNRNGLWHSQLVGNHLITAYIPFLPLERVHVRKCIQDAILAKGIFKIKDREQVPVVLIEDVMKELRFDEELFSVTGCKRVAEKVDFVILDLIHSHEASKKSEL